MEIGTDRDLIKELEVAAPQSCPSNICIASDSPNPSTTQKPQMNSQGSNVSSQSRLNDLNELRRKGLITQQDYDLKKAEILKSM